MISRANLQQMVQSANIPNPVLKAALGMAIPLLGEDIFSRVIPAMIQVVRPLAEGDGQQAVSAFSECVTPEDRAKLLAFISSLNGNGNYPVE